MSCPHGKKLNECGEDKCRIAMAAIEIPRLVKEQAALIRERSDLLDAVSLTPRGFRDVYWCDINNEPTMLIYKDGKPCCTDCGCDPVANAEGLHHFIAHIHKPVRR